MTSILRPYQFAHHKIRQETVACLAAEFIFVYHRGCMQRKGPPERIEVI